jgi:hypothetical protein
MSAAMQCRPQAGSAQLHRALRHDLEAQHLDHRIEGEEEDAAIAGPKSSDSQSGRISRSDGPGIGCLGGASPGSTQDQWPS